MEWIILVVAGCLECVWAVGLKYTEGFSRPLPSIVTAVAAICSFWLLAVAMKSIPAGSAYAGLDRNRRCGCGCRGSRTF